MKTKSPPKAIRISATEEVKKALLEAKKIYPTLSDPEIFKLGLSKIVRDEINVDRASEEKEIMVLAAHAVGHDYLSDPDEDTYHLGIGKKVNLK